jgi:hypothetical protein
MNIDIKYIFDKKYVNVVVDGECNHAEAEQELMEFAHGPDTIVKNVMVCTCGDIEQMEWDGQEGDEY